MATGDWYFKWDKAPLNTAATGLDYLAAMSTKLIWQPLYPLDMVKEGCFLLPRVKAELAAISVTQESFKET
jgi:hypothetical protein